jgi:hypothetical protein
LLIVPGFFECRFLTNNKQNPAIMKIIQLFVLSAICSSFSGAVMAQNFTASVTLTPAANYMSAGVCQVTLADSSNTSRIELVLRDRVADSAWFSHEFIFDQVSGLPSGLSWQRNGVEVTLGLGLLPRQPGWNGRVRVKDASDNWSDPLDFIFQ